MSRSGLQTVLLQQSFPKKGGLQVHCSSIQDPRTLSLQGAERDTDKKAQFHTHTTCNWDTYPHNTVVYIFKYYTILLEWQA